MMRLAPSAVSAILMLIAVALDQRASMSVAFGSTSRLVYVLSAALVGGLILLRYPRHAVGWIFTLVALAAATNSVASDYARSRFAIGDPLAVPLGWFASWSWFAEIALLVIALPLLFPGGRPVSPRWWAVGWAGAAAVVLLSLHAAIAPGPLEMLPAVDNYAVDAPGIVLLAEAGFAALILAILGSIASSTLRFRRAASLERQQMKWLLWALVMFAAAFIFAALTFRPNERNVAVETAIVAAGTLVPIAAGLAILRYRLYDIDVLINRTLVYGPLSATLLALYFGTVLALSALLRPLTGSSDLAVAGSTLGVVALFAPLRARLQSLVDRSFYRSRYDAERTVDAFAARLRDQVDLALLERDLLGVLQHTVRPSHSALWLRDR